MVVVEAALVTFFVFLFDFALINTNYPYMYSFFFFFHSFFEPDHQLYADFFSSD